MTEKFEPKDHVLKNEQPEGFVRIDESGEGFVIPGFQEARRDGNKEEALRLLDEYMGNNPENHRLYALRANLLGSLGRRREEINMWKKAIELDPNNPDYRTWIAQHLWHDGKKEEAILMAREVLKNHPGHVFASSLLAKGQVEVESDEPNALATLTEASKKNPDDPLIQHELMELGNRPGIKALLSAVFEDQPDEELFDK